MTIYNCDMQFTIYLCRNTSNNTAKAGFQQQMGPC